jgi:phage baseplate assembly protein V
LDDHLYALGELDRRVNNMVRFGTVFEVDPSAALAKVNLGELVTDWLPWAITRAGNNRTWYAPEVGEQVILLSAGDPSMGVIIGALYQTAHPANGSTIDVERTTYQDGTVVEYDRASHQLLIDASASTSNVLIKCSTATINATSSVTVDSPMTHCTGQLMVDGLLTYGNGIAGTGGGNGNHITGDIHVTSGNVTADGVGLKTHIHGGVQRASSNTDGPSG